MDFDTACRWLDTHRSDTIILENIWFSKEEADVFFQILERNTRITTLKILQIFTNFSNGCPNVLNRLKSCLLNNRTLKQVTIELGFNNDRYFSDLIKYLTHHKSVAKLKLIPGPSSKWNWWSSVAELVSGNAILESLEIVPDIKQTPRPTLEDHMGGFGKLSESLALNTQLVELNIGLPNIDMFPIMNQHWHMPWSSANQKIISNKYLLLLEPQRASSGILEFTNDDVIALSHQKSVGVDIRPHLFLHWCLRKKNVPKEIIKHILGPESLWFTLQLGLSEPVFNQTFACYPGLRSPDRKSVFT